VDSFLKRLCIIIFLINVPTLLPQMAYGQCIQDGQQMKISEVCDNESFNPKFSTACSKDADCTSGPNGRCRLQYHFDISERFCTYDACFSDEDCGSLGTCSCGSDNNIDIASGRADENACVVSNCKTNSDCGDYYCKPNQYPCQDFHDTKTLGYFCTTENDVRQ